MENLIASASIVVHATPAEVWDALTKPELIKQYLFGTDASSDWKVGSAITYKGAWKGKAYEDHGKILEIVPEKLLATTYWSAGFGKSDLPENYKNVSYILKDLGGSTKLTITQDGNTTDDEKKQSESNWTTVLASLKKVVEK